MKNLMISFIGEQPIPNLIPVKFEKPEATLLVHTERTEGKAERIM